MADAAGIVQGMMPKRSSQLSGAMTLIILGSCVFGLLSFLMLGIGAATMLDLGGAEGTRLGGLLYLAYFAVSGMGSYCGVTAVLAIRDGDLRRALKRGIAASLLPPVEVIALFGTLMMLLSPEWKAMQAPRHAVPPGLAFVPVPSTAPGPAPPSARLAPVRRPGLAPSSRYDAGWGVRPGPPKAP